MDAWRVASRYHGAAAWRGDQALIAVTKRLCGLGYAAFIAATKAIRAFLTSRRVRRALLVLVIVWLAGVVLLILSILIYGRSDRAQQADVIVVLGAGVTRDSRPGPALTRRSKRAAELWQQGLAPQIICSGGQPGYATRSEADACREVLVSQGVPAAVILLEEQSRSTEENARFTREVMDANGWRTAIVVSDGYHLLRAAWLFSSQGITNYTSPAADPSFPNLLSAMSREVAAFHWQALKDVLNLPFTYVPVL